jgi:hypothetical protein
MTSDRANLARVFISHAGDDSEAAVQVARLLTDGGVETRLDRQHLTIGEGFLAFMNDALATSSYCLLLWSRAAARSPWVTIEWESALVRSVREKRGFLVVARLEELEVPALLQPRLWIDLFPDLDLGVRAVLDAWRRDRHVESIANKPVGSAHTAVPCDERGAELYLTSELFGLTLPLRLSRAHPIAVLTDRIVTQLGLPRTWQHDGRVGVTFRYALSLGDRVLRPAATLAEERVAEHALLTLVVEMKAFALEAPTSGELPRASFRKATRRAREQSRSDPTVAARSALRSALRLAGIA